MGQHYRQAGLRAARALTATLGLTFSVGSCGSLKRVQECERVIVTVNSGLEQVRQHLPDAGADARAYVAIAAEYVRLGDNIQALSSRDETLQRAIDSYREVATRAAQSSRDYSEELARPTASKAERKSKKVRLQRIRTLAKNDLTREAAAVRKLNALCHPE
jgi:hypothetical protein